MGDRDPFATLDDGRKIDPQETYKVAGWAQVNRTPEGPLLRDLTRDYILKARDPDTKVLTLKKVNHPKLIGVSDDPGMKHYPGELG